MIHEYILRNYKYNLNLKIFKKSSDIGKEITLSVSEEENYKKINKKTGYWILISILSTYNRTCLYIIYIIYKISCSLSATSTEGQPIKNLNHDHRCQEHFD